MIKEEDVLAALEKPLTIHALKNRLDPSAKNLDALQELRMRTQGTVKFDIKSGRWDRA